MRNRIHGQNTSRGELTLAKKVADENASTSSSTSPTIAHSRRAFLKGLGAAATIVGSAPVAAAAARHAMPDVISDLSSPNLNLKARRGQAYQKRVSAAVGDRKVPTPPHPNNGDEALYPSGYANFTKGFAHSTSGSNIGVVDPTVYAAYLRS